MRITMQSIHKNILTNLNKITTDMNRVNTQISSGKQMSTISDNPVNLVTALGLRSNLSQITTYQDNLSFGDKTITAAENALTQMKDLALRAKTLAIQLANGSITPENRLSAAEEVQNIFESAITLANTSVNGKYIFGGYKTSGYSDVEPTPFIQDARDGYFVNGAAQSRMDEHLTGTVGNGADLAVDDLLLNGVDVGAVDLDTVALTVNGLNMGGADNLKTAINATASGVSATLTTLSAGAAATAPGAASLTFYVNGTAINLTTGGGTPTQTAHDVRDAINAQSGLTGVTAEVGNALGDNGGITDSIILKNTRKGDESAIILSGLSAAEEALTGFTEGTNQAADATHNTGEISLSSTAAFSITTSDTASDSILDLIGIGGGNIGFADKAADGELVYGSKIGSNDLLINGIEVIPQSDGLSDVYADISAAAKADAINEGTAEHGVSAQFTPASLRAAGAVEAGTEAAKLTGTVQDALNIGIGDLAINGIATLSAVNILGAPANGLNMQRASDLRDAINEISGSSGVTANLTTLSAGAPVDHTLGTATINFTLNGITVAFNANGTNDAAVAMQTVAAINAVSAQTGVTAARGDGGNGGPIDSIVLSNTLPGDEEPIILAGINPLTEGARIGLADINQNVDATHNTGDITFSSDAPITLSSPNNLNDDNILKEFALNGGEDYSGISGDLPDDGVLEYGSTPTYLASGDLIINGIDIFTKTTPITSKDDTNAVINAINAKQEDTGVIAGRNSAGNMILTAVDGRNLHIETSALGEKVTHLNGGSPAPNSKVYFGEVRLFAGREFFMESGTTAVGALTVETGFAALGLNGGQTATGVTGDTADDGSIFVNTINYEDGYVRYAGDRTNDFAVKVGQQSTIDVGKNGMSAVMDTGIFTVLKNLQDALRGQNYTTLDGAAKALDTHALLNSGKTGLPLEGELHNGSFTIVVSNHDTSPPTTLSSTTINIDTAKDSLADIAQRINGIPGISSSWSGDGHLLISSNDSARYTFALSDDTSNFLRVTGSELDNIQVSNISNSIAELDDLMQNLTTQISDFGAKANRIIVQQNIYANLSLSTKENLSEKEDTDITKALMEIKSKETAYEAALAAAAKTMQLSLLDFLK